MFSKKLFPVRDAPNTDKTTISRSLTFSCRKIFWKSSINSWNWLNLFTHTICTDWLSQSLDWHSIFTEPFDLLHLFYILFFDDERQKINEISNILNIHILEWIKFRDLEVWRYKTELKIESWVCACVHSYLFMQTPRVSNVSAKWLVYSSWWSQNRHYHDQFDTWAGSCSGKETPVQNVFLFISSYLFINRENERDRIELRESTNRRDSRPHSNSLLACSLTGMCMIELVSAIKPFVCIGFLFVWYFQYEVAYTSHFCSLQAGDMVFQSYMSGDRLMDKFICIIIQIAYYFLAALWMILFN